MSQILKLVKGDVTVTLSRSGRRSPAPTDLKQEVHAALFMKHLKEFHESHCDSALVLEARGGGETTLVWWDQDSEERLRSLLAAGKTVWAVVGLTEDTIRSHALSSKATPSYLQALGQTIKRHLETPEPDTNSVFGILDEG